jgi:glycosyltransferase involved in cell wall biosynthesis
MDKNKDTILSALHNKQYPQAEQLAIESIKRQPRVAQTWVHLGEALLHQGCGLAARAAFDRAWLLDPQAPWVDAVKATLASAPDGPAKQAIDELLKVKSITVAAVIMTRNEERCIERCIRSLIEAYAVDEILVLDSSSTDRTLEIVAQFAQVKVLKDVRIEDDFAGKRNYGLNYIDSDWVIWIDADEWLDPEDSHVIRQAAGIFQELDVPVALNICQMNHIGDSIVPEYSIPRMFPLNRGLRYHGRVHEQVIREGDSLFDSSVFRYSVRIRLHHDGYESSVVSSRDKLERNLRLLRLMVEEEPDNPGWIFYLARETLSSGDVDAALGLLLEAEVKAALQPRFGRLLDVHLLLLKIYMSRKDLDLAQAVCERSLKIHPDYPDTLYMLAQIRMRKAVSLLQQSEKELREAKHGFRTYRGMVTADKAILDWKSDASLADLARLLGKTEEAKRLYRSILERYPELESVRKKLGKLE